MLSANIETASSLICDNRMNEKNPASMGTIVTKYSF